jgi:hypothetical protein
MTPEITQLLIDALRSLLAGGPDGLEQARVKVEQAQQLLLGDESETRRSGGEATGEVREARDALERVQKGRVWFEPHSDCLNPVIEAIAALDKLAGYDAGGRNA